MKHPTSVRISCQLNSRRSDRMGMTLVEVVVSTVISGFILVGALNLVGASLRGASDTNRRTEAVFLAEDLMNEILAQYYIEPDDASVFGVEENDLDKSIRADWDDVDDYDGWAASPPRDADGVDIPNTTGWSRTVTVTHVDPDDLSTVLDDDDDSGVKRITVDVSYGGEVLTSLVAIQTEAWLDMIPDPGNDHTTGSTPSYF